MPLFFFTARAPEAPMSPRTPSPTPELQQQTSTEWRVLKSTTNRPELDMFADDDQLALAQAAAGKPKFNEDSNQQLLGASENPNLTDNWEDAEG